MYIYTIHYERFIYHIGSGLGSYSIKLFPSGLKENLGYQQKAGLDGDGCINSDFSPTDPYLHRERTRTTCVISMFRTAIKSKYVTSKPFNI